MMFLLMIAAVFLSAYPAAAGTYTITSCGDCHGYPPMDSATRGSPTGAVKGSHATHAEANPAGYAFDCTVCHANSGYDYGHRNGVIEMANPLTSPSGTYSKGGSFPQSNDPVPGACGSVYCHGNGASVASGSIPPYPPVSWSAGATVECNSCHGNTSYAAGDYRKAAPLYVSGSPKSNAHQFHVRADGSAETDISCNQCHYSVTTNNTSIADKSLHVNKAYTVQGSGAAFPSPSWAGPGTGAPGAVSISTYSFSPSGSICSSVSCHPDGQGTTTTAWGDVYACTDCHDITMTSAGSYHHVMDAAAMANRTYPIDVPSGSASDGSRKCTMCHVDHTIFSPMLNANNTVGRSMNLRTAIGTVPDPANAATYTNSDYAVGGGICISCHTNELAKNVTARKTDGAAVTMAIADVDYSSSAHRYTVPSAFSSGTSTFNADCAKCHSTSEPAKFQDSAATFRTHDSPRRRLLADLGMSAPADPEEEDFCYRCHSLSYDSNPGGGPAKPVAEMDYFGAVAMKVSSESMYSLGRYTITNTLYFRETPPSLPAPVGTGSPDVFQGGAWQARDMLPVGGSSLQVQTVTISDTGDPRYWQMTSFVSPPVEGVITIPTATWTLTLWGSENNLGANCYVRATIYIWTAGGAQGQIITSPTSLNDVSTWIPDGCDEQSGECWAGYWYVDSYELKSYYAANTLPLSGSQVTLAVGDRIVVEVEVDSRAPAVAGYAATYTWNYFDSRIVIPVDVPFTWFASSTSAHHMENYSGLHKPSPADETRASLSANRHIECNDCHNPHAASAGTHSQGTNTVSNAVRGVDGVRVPAWPASWTTPTFDDARETATMEWQICFKCHSSYNTNLAGWDPNWTDLAKEFNPNNPSYHAVIGTSKLPGQGSFVNGWTNTSTMTCSDCHASNRAGPDYPQGPHVSEYGGILKGDGQSKQFCFNCHDAYFTVGSGFSGPDGELHSCHFGWCGTIPESSNPDALNMNCATCHSKVPHGAPRPRLFVLNGDDPRYLDPSTGHLNSWTQNTGNYSGGECQGYCH